MTRLQRGKHNIVCKAQTRAVFNSVSHDHNKEEGNGEETDCPWGQNSQLPGGIFKLYLYAFSFWSFSYQFLKGQCFSSLNSTPKQESQ